MAPALAQFEQKYADSVKVIEINVDDRNSAAGKQYAGFKGSNYIPETVVIKDGKAAARKVGAMSVEDLVQLSSAGK